LPLGTWNAVQGGGREVTVGHVHTRMLRVAYGCPGRPRWEPGAYEDISGMCWHFPRARRFLHQGQGSLPPLPSPALRNPIQPRAGSPPPGLCCAPHPNRGSIPHILSRTSRWRPPWGRSLSKAEAIQDLYPNPAALRQAYRPTALVAAHRIGSSVRTHTPHLYTTGLWQYSFRFRCGHQT